MGSGPNSVLSLGMEPRKYQWGFNAKNVPSLMNISSGSSGNSSSRGSNESMEWTGLVERVFREEIGKMAEGMKKSINI